MGVLLGKETLKTQYLNPAAGSNIGTQSPTRRHLPVLSQDLVLCSLSDLVDEAKERLIYYIYSDIVLVLWKVELGFILRLKRWY